MTHRHTLFAVLTLAASLTWGCTKPSDDEADSRAKPGPAADAAPETKPATGPAPQVERDPELPEAQADPDKVPPGKQLGPEQLAPGVDPPPPSEVVRIARDQGLKNPAVAAKPVGYGPRTYVTAVRTRDDGVPTRYRLELMTVNLPAEGEPVWALGARHRLFDWQDEDWSDDSSAIPTSLFVDDYDADGEPEVMVRFRYEEMLGGGGLNTFTDMVILNASHDPITQAFSTNLHHTVTVYETKGKASFEDLDGDGHPDLRIELREFEEDEPAGTRESQWLWSPSTDTYVAKR